MSKVFALYAGLGAPRRVWAIRLLQMLCTLHALNVYTARDARDREDITAAIVVDPQSSDEVSRLVEKHGKVVVVVDSRDKLPEFAGTKAHKIVVTTESPAEAAREIAPILKRL